MIDLKLKSAALKFLKPIKKLSVCDWAERYLMLPSTSSEPGRFKVDRTPFMRDIMNAFTDDKVHRVIAMTSSQVGKALDIETPIPTPEGWKLMRDIKVGDKVFDENGDICKVTGATEIMTGHRCFEISFSDGAKIVADAEHLWTVQEGFHGRFTEKVKTTLELSKDFVEIRNRQNNYRYAIPVAKALNLPEKDLPIDPYVLGYWLGDGKSARPDFSVAFSDLENILNKISKLYHYRVTEFPQKNCCEVYLSKKIDDEKSCFRLQLRQLNLLNNKHIPAIYLRASASQRMELLRGLMDTDGTISANGAVAFAQKSTTLAFQVVDLLCSLGFKPTVKLCKNTFGFTTKESDAKIWLIRFTAYADTPIFHLQRKLERQKKAEGKYFLISKRRRITEIREVESRAVKCIAVDSASHLYLAGKNFIPTHNSTALNNVIGRYACLDPCCIMLIQPTQELAEKYSKTRIVPMIEDSKVLKPLFNNRNQTILEKFFTGGQLLMTGSNSPANLASQPVRIVLCDEVDRFAEDLPGEGDPVKLATARTTTFWNYKIGLFSTPTIKNHSRIEQEFLLGTQEYWSYKCPNCGEFFYLNYRNFVSKDKIYYRCEDCGFEFTEQEIKSAEQKYIAKNPAALAKGIRSFWVNAFSSPWLSWRQIFEEWQEARGKPALEKVVMNTRFAESYEIAADKSLVDENEFLKRRIEYGAELPDGVLILTAAVDVQANRLEFEVVGWGAGEVRYGIWRDIVQGNPAQYSTWQELDAVLDRQYYFADGRSLKVARTFIDSGYSARQVYSYCAENLHKGRYAIKGKGAPGLPLIYQYTYPKGYGITLTILGVNDGKQEIFSRLKISRDKGEGIRDKKFLPLSSYPLPLTMIFPVDDEYFTRRGYDEIYFKQLFSERQVLKRTSGVAYLAYEPLHKGIRNESLDLAVYNLACVKSLNLDWAELEVEVNSAVQQPEVKQKKSATRSRRLAIF